MSDRDDRETGHDDDALLRDALAALRDSKDGRATDFGAATTRRSVIAGAMKHSRRRVLILRVVAPLAAVLVVSTAFAAATGRLPRVIAVLAEVARGEADRDHAREAPSHATSAPPTSPVASLASTAPASPPPQPPPSSMTPSAPPPAKKIASASSTAIAIAAAPPRDVADPEETAYRAAHTEHFVNHNDVEALRGWDAYLAAYPSGRFAPEARYNRALTLVRLGRRDEAKAALKPFADGAISNGYRQREAQRLLDALATSP